MKRFAALVLSVVLLLSVILTAEADDGLTGTYTIYNRTGETVTELYLIDNLTGEIGENYAGDEGFADGDQRMVTRTITAEEKAAGYSMTVFFKTDSGYEARYATLHIEEAPVTLLAADAMTGPTPISFFAPIEAALPELENATVEAVSMDPVKEAVLPELENATVEAVSMDPMKEAVLPELENATVEAVSMDPMKEAVLPELENATVEAVSMDPMKEAVLPELENATVEAVSMDPMKEAVLPELENATVEAVSMDPVKEAVLPELENATVSAVYDMDPVAGAVVADLDGSDEVEVPLYSGLYIVGKNIKAGVYHLKIGENAQSIVLDLYRNVDDYIARTNRINKDSMILGAKGLGLKVTLEDGMVLALNINNGFISVPVQKSAVPDSMPESSLEAGTYVAGENISPGNYIIMIGRNAQAVVYELYSSKEDMESRQNRLNTETIIYGADHAGISLPLEEGMAFSLEVLNGYVTIIDAEPAWMR